MLRLAAALLLGTALGTAVVLLASGRFSQPPSEVPSNLQRSARTPLPAESAPEFDAQAEYAEPAAALVALARRSPAAALAELEALGPASRRAALAAVARALVRDDPVSALRLVERVRANLRGELYDALLTQWSLDDPAAAVAWLASLDSTRARTMVFDRDFGWPRTLAAAAPELVFETAQAIPGDYGSMLRQQAMRALAERDPTGAAAIVLSTPIRADRDRYASSVGRVLGAHDPLAAIDWLRGMEEPNWNAVQSTLTGIAQTDLSLAFDFYLTEPMASTIQLGAFTIYPQALSSADVPTIAARIAASGNPKARQLLQRLLQAWAEHDIDAMIPWVAANEPSFLATAAGSYARRDLDGAMRLAETMAPAQRATWIRGALNEVDDPREAIRRLAAYRNEPFYEAAYNDILQFSVLTAPPRVAVDLVGTAPAAIREFLLPQVAQRFASVDPKSARDWALGQPAGAERDRVISAVLAELSRAGAFDAALLSAIDNPATRENSLVQAFVQMGGVDKDTSLRIFDEHFQDPALRARIETSIDRARVRTEQFRRERNAPR